MPVHHRDDRRGQTAPLPADALEQVRAVAGQRVRGEGLDDVHRIFQHRPEVQARAEGVAGTGEDHAAQVAVAAQGLGGVVEAAEHRHGQAVELGRPVQRHHGDAGAVDLLVGDGHGGVGGGRGGAGGGGGVLVRGHVGVSGGHGATVSSPVGARAGFGRMQGFLLDDGPPKPPLAAGVE